MLRLSYYNIYGSSITVEYLIQISTGVFKHLQVFNIRLIFLQKTLEEHGNIIQYVQTQILNDLSFSRYAMSLLVIVVIFEKKILIESRIKRKLDF